jgi:hypothetical protein
MTDLLKGTVFSENLQRDIFSKITSIMNHDTILSLKVSSFHSFLWSIGRQRERKSNNSFQLNTFCIITAKRSTNVILQLIYGATNDAPLQIL